MPRPRSKTPPCPDCGGPSISNGRRDGGKKKSVRRYRCTGEVPGTLCSEKPRRFTELTAESPREAAKVEPVPTRESLRDDTHVFLITWAQNATKVHDGFWKALQACREHRDADLIVIQGRYRNPTTKGEAVIMRDNKITAPNDLRDEWWDDKVVPHLWNKRGDLCAALTILGDIRVSPTAQTPLSGYDSITGPKSGILGHPKLELRVIPTPQQQYPKQMQTTGACTVQRYSDSGAGAKGEFHHTIGAVIVEVRGDAFHMRQLNAVRDGSFIDLDTEYLPDGTSRPAGDALALSMGDWHSGFTDPEVIAATFPLTGDGSSIIEVCRPGILLWDDLLDQYGRNHHHRDNPFIAIAKERDTTYDRGDLMHEVRSACDEVNYYTSLAEAALGKSVQSVIKASNHDEALTRYIIERSWKNDPKNAEFYLETALRMARATRMKPSGADYPQAFHVWAEELCPSAILLGRRSSFMVADIECAMHGDIGPNGARGSLLNLSKIGVKSIIGHSHTPGIRHGCYQTGTSTYLDLEYAKGASSWMNTHCVVYANGKRALITIISGRGWRYA